MGNGTVVSVTSRSKDDRDYVGETVYILHDLHDGSVMFAYTHLENVIVSKDSVVKHGTKLGETWKSWDHRWIRHVHIDVVEDLPDTELEPLQYIAGCRVGQRLKLTYPFACQ
jgi:hypothetical protein